MADCLKCLDKGAYSLKEAAEERRLADGSMLISGPSYSTILCDCRKDLAPREGRAAWWASEQVYAADVRIPIFDEQVSIVVKAEVPVSAENFRVARRGNRYYPTLIDLACPNALTLHACTARSLAAALIAAADAAEKVDDADTDPMCGHWAPCDCRAAETPQQGA